MPDEPLAVAEPEAEFLLCSGSEVGPAPRKAASVAHQPWTHDLLRGPLALLSPLALLATWEILVRLSIVDFRFFPPPSSIFQTLLAMTVSGELFHHLAASLTRILVGFLLGAIPGLVVGLTMGLFRIVRASLSPIVAATYPIPKIAILPLVMLVFGLGETSKYVIVAVAVFFLVLYNTTAGVVNIPSIYLDVGKNFGAKRKDLYLAIAFPGALPLILTGFRLAIGVALIVIVAAEFVSARSGIGFLIWQSWQILDISSMYAGLVVISLLGYLSSLALDAVEHWVIPWNV